jgi:hypothetical protein
MSVPEGLPGWWSGPEQVVYSAIVARSRRRAWLVWGLAGVAVLVALLAFSPAASLALGTIVFAALLVAGDRAPWLLVPGRLGTALRAYHWIGVDMQERAEQALGPGVGQSPGEIRRRASQLTDRVAARRALAGAACLERNWEEAIASLGETLPNESALDRFLDVTLVHRASLAIGQPRDPGELDIASLALPEAERSRAKLYIGLVRAFKAAAADEDPIGPLAAAWEATRGN